MISGYYLVLTSFAVILGLIAWYYATKEIENNE